MTPPEILLILLIAAICGGIGQTMVGYSAGGCISAIVVGIIGAYVGIWLAGYVGLPPIFTITISGNAFPIIWCIVGAAIFSAALGLVNRLIVGPRR
ncbi:hypothetical protein Pse7367_1267 [Thalassoporum mexicanum PCC 7367]|uniref:GlsB/YeaQ/YmgE family stress response membrane protein n=1 Tax=Thalassoporum mexicanum TaxID=3457544 RepID=UPI00029FD81A|nr:hypothetical protein [Pseudanabaena sp. PCC 7367]AFY69561.1 hypothetical protein Pse7367_1267 [Pseudanabaena sp. PCC 7367]